MSELGFLAFGLPEEINPVEAAQNKAAAIAKINAELTSRGIFAFVMNADSVPEVEQRLLMREVDGQISDVVDRYLPGDDDAKQRVVSNIFKKFEASRQGDISERLEEERTNKEISKGLVCARCTARFASRQKPGSVCLDCHEDWFAIETEDMVKSGAVDYSTGADEDLLPYGDDVDATAADALGAADEGSELDDEETDSSDGEDYFCDDPNCDCNETGIPHEGIGDSLIDDDSEDADGTEDGSDEDRSSFDSELDPREASNNDEDEDDEDEDEDEDEDDEDEDEDEDGTKKEGRLVFSEDEAAEEQAALEYTGKTRNCINGNHSDCQDLYTQPDDCGCECHTGPRNYSGACEDGDHDVCRMKDCTCLCH